MLLCERESESQHDFWLEADRMATDPGHLLYDKLNRCSGNQVWICCSTSCATRTPIVAAALQVSASDADDHLPGMDCL